MRLLLLLTACIASACSLFSSASPCPSSTEPTQPQITVIRSNEAVIQRCESVGRAAQSFKAYCDCTVDAGLGYLRDGGC